MILSPLHTHAPAFPFDPLRNTFTPLRESGNEKWIVKIVKSEKCITISLFSQLGILWFGKFSHKSLAKTMQRQHKEKEAEEDDVDDDEEETLARDRVCDLGTPINYRKCHFKCRESHNVHNQFKFWQICPARNPLKKRERDRGRESERKIVARILQPPKPTRVRHLHNHNLEIVRGLISSFLASFLLSCLSHSPIAFCFQ